MAHLVGRACMPGALGGGEGFMPAKKQSRRSPLEQHSARLPWPAYFVFSATEPGIQKVWSPAEPRPPARRFGAF